MSVRSSVSPQSSAAWRQRAKCGVCAVRLERGLVGVDLVEDEAGRIALDRADVEAEAARAPPRATPPPGRGSRRGSGRGRRAAPRSRRRARAQPEPIRAPRPVQDMSRCLTPITRGSRLRNAAPAAPFGFSSSLRRFPSRSCGPWPPRPDMSRCLTPRSPGRRAAQTCPRAPRLCACGSSCSPATGSRSSTSPGSSTATPRSTAGSPSRESRKPAGSAARSSRSRSTCSSPRRFRASCRRRASRSAPATCPTSSTTTSATSASASSRAAPSTTTARCPAHADPTLRFPGGESLNEAALRYAAAFERLLARGEPVTLVVCHEIPVRYAVNAAAGSAGLNGPLHDVANATPYVFDEAALRRAVERIGS